MTEPQPPVLLLECSMTLAGTERTASLSRAQAACVTQPPHPPPGKQEAHAATPDVGTCAAFSRPGAQFWGHQEGQPGGNPRQPYRLTCE